MNLERIPGQLEAEFAQITCRQRISLPQSKQSTGRNRRYHRWGRYLLDFLTGQQQLAIREQQRNGQCQWAVYDPETQRRHVFNSQSAVRAWLEQRYHR